MDWKKLIGTVAPTIATALGGPLAGLATKALSASLLGKPESTESEIADAIAAAGPAELLKLKELDTTFALEMKKLDIDLEKISADDRASARAREISTGDHTQRNLAYLALALFSAVLIAQFAIGAHPVWSIDDAATRTIDITTGILFAWVMAVKDYYFGSSSGSKEKSEHITRLTGGGK